MRRPIDAPYTITTEFGVSDSNALYGYHSGVDYYLSNQPTGSPVHAPIAGKVVYAQLHPVRGNMVVIFDGVFYHRLMHNSRFNTQVGVQVNEGDVVSFTGSTGLATGPHCHWDINTYGIDTTAFSQFISPADWLDGKYNDRYVQPAPIQEVLQPFQRRVKADGVNYRTAPSVNASIIKEFPPNDILDFSGFVHGETYAGNDIWFKGRYTGGYSWSGSFTDPGTGGLPDLTPPPTPSPQPQPDPAPTLPPIVDPMPEPESFRPDALHVTNVEPSPNYIEQPMAPEFIVIHQWDDPAKLPSYTGVIAHFKKTDPGTSPHYVLDDTHTTQMIPESKRAQHAGPKGNDGYGIEFDPNGGEDMYARGRELIADMRKRTGKPLPLRPHSDFMVTDCPKYIDMKRLEPLVKIDIDLDKRVAALEDFRDKMIQFFKNQ